MLQFREYHIRAPWVKSLCWQDGYLVDWVAGNVYHLDGSTASGLVSYGYRFDTVIASPSGKFVVIYERLGTKGLVLHNGKFVREIDRSYYFAEDYEYPVTFLRRRDGRELLVHCPKEYCRIDIEDVITGECLTASIERKPADMFHSCLACSPSGQWLLSAGWFWHPVDMVELFNVDEAITDPTVLDRLYSDPQITSEIYTAAFRDDHTLILLTPDDSDRAGKGKDGPLSLNSSRVIACYDLMTREYSSIVRAEEIVGKPMPLAGGYLVGFYEYPKLFEIATGKVVHRWPELATGTQTGSIQHHIGEVPPFAMDAANSRFAVAGKDAITVFDIIVE